MIKERLIFGWMFFSTLALILLAVYCFNLIEKVETPLADFESVTETLRQVDEANFSKLQRASKKVEKLISPELLKNLPDSLLDEAVRVEQAGMNYISFKSDLDMTLGSFGAALLTQRKINLLLFYAVIGCILSNLLILLLLKRHK